MFAKIAGDRIITPLLRLHLPVARENIFNEFSRKRVQRAFPVYVKTARQRIFAAVGTLEGRVVSSLALARRDGHAVHAFGPVADPRISNGGDLVGDRPSVSLRAGLHMRLRLEIVAPESVLPEIFVRARQGVAAIERDWPLRPFTGQAQFIDPPRLRGFLCVASPRRIQASALS